MMIHKAGSRPTQTPDPNYFTGRVQIDPIISAPDPSHVSALRVSFEPGARTAWHTHPLGQTIHILSGTCWAQVEGQEKVTLQPGDTCYFTPGQRHWHGATDACGMVHLAIQEAVDGSAANWLEQVSDADYAG